MYKYIIENKKEVTSILIIHIYNKVIVIKSIILRYTKAIEQGEMKTN